MALTPGIAQLWRTTPDITDSWSSVADIIRRSVPLSPSAGPGRWNDPDMLEIGGGGLSPDEGRTHFAVWSMLAAPLLAGTDLASATPRTLALLGNRALIAVDKDPLGAPVEVVSDDAGGVLVLRRPLADGTRAVPWSTSRTRRRRSRRTCAASTLLTGRPVDARALPPHATAVVRS